MATIHDAVSQVLGASENDITAVLEALAVHRFYGHLPVRGPFLQLSEATLKRWGLDDMHMAIVQSAQSEAKATATSAASGAAAGELDRLNASVQQLSLGVEKAKLEAGAAKQEAGAALKGQEELKLQVFKMSLTTRTYNDVGKVLRQKLTKDLLLLSIVRTEEIAAACKAAIEAVMNLEVADSEETGESAGRGGKRRRQDKPPPSGAPEAMSAAAPVPRLQRSEHAGGSTAVHEVPEAMSLEAAMRRKFGIQNKWNEENHLQPVTFAVLNAVAKQFGSTTGLTLEDTHRICSLRSPAAKPDITMLAAPLQAWTQTVGTVEIKVTDADADANVAMGQLQQSSAAVLDAQKDRTSMFSASMTMKSIEVFKFNRELAVMSSDIQPFSIDRNSAGFQLLVRLLATSTVNQGFLPAQIPKPQLQNYTVDKVLLLRRGSASSSSSSSSRSSSFVYQVEAVEASGRSGALPGMPVKAVLKLNMSEHEGDVLHKLRGQPNIVQLLDRGTCQFQECRWHAVLLVPFVEHLTCSNSLELLAQVTVDVACALGAAAEEGILHRDVTPNNIGHSGGRGFLLDFSAAADVSDQEETSAAPPETPPDSPLSGVTGTLLWASYSVLRGCTHTLSSQLEGLFLSILYISMDGKRWPGRLEQGGVSASEWCGFRRQHLGGPQLLQLDMVQEHLKPLVKRLHDLFWKPGSFDRVYRRDVKVSEVCGACREACPPESLTLLGGMPP